MRPKETTRGRAAGLPTAGSLLLLLATICSAYVVPEGHSVHAPASRAVSGPRSPSAQAVKSRILGQLSLSRRQAVRSEVRSLFASLLSLPAAIAFTSAPDRLSRPFPPQPDVAASPGAFPAFIQRPPPAIA